MGLIVSNRLTDKQRDMLERLNYCGTWQLTVEEAGAVIDELLAERRMHRDDYEPDLFQSYDDNQN